MSGLPSSITDGAIPLVHDLALAGMRGRDHECVERRHDCAGQRRGSSARREFEAFIRAGLGLGLVEATQRAAAGISQPDHLLHPPLFLQPAHIRGDVENDLLVDTGHVVPCVRTLAPIHAYPARSNAG